MADVKPAEQKQTGYLTTLKPLQYKPFFGNPKSCIYYPISCHQFDHFPVEITIPEDFKETFRAKPYVVVKGFNLKVLLTAEEQERYNDWKANKEDYRSQFPFNSLSKSDEGNNVYVVSRLAAGFYLDWNYKHEYKAHLICGSWVVRVDRIAFFTANLRCWMAMEIALPDGTVLGMTESARIEVQEIQNSTREIIEKPRSRK